MHIGEKIKERREQLQLTQDDLAKMLGYKSRSTINKIELGKTDITQSRIVAYAKALQTTPAYLMGWEQSEKKNDIISDVILRLRSDDEFLNAVESMYKLSSEQLSAVLPILQALKQ